MKYLHTVSTKLDRVLDINYLVVFARSESGAWKPPYDFLIITDSVGRVRIGLAV